MSRASEAYMTATYSNFDAERTYVKVTVAKGSDVTELPCEENGMLLIETVTRHFQGAVGMRFKNPSSGNWRSVPLRDEQLCPPDLNSWPDVIYEVIFSGDESPNTLEVRPGDQANEQNLNGPPDFLHKIWESAMPFWSKPVYEVLVGFFSEIHARQGLRTGDRSNVPALDVPDGPRTAEHQTGEQLAAMCDEFDEIYVDRIKHLVKQLFSRRKKSFMSYEDFKGVCDGIFSKEITWTRIFSLFQFCYHYVMEYSIWCELKNVSNPVFTVICYAMKYIVAEMIQVVANTVAHWIENHGGWQSSLSHLGISTGRLIALMSVGVLITGVVYLTKR